MQHLDQFKKPENIDKVINAINSMNTRPIKIMEICGTHTMAIARSGIKSLLNSNVKLISGPGCPVCVTPSDRIDKILELVQEKNIIIATYGDMLKVPGTKYGDSLEKHKAMGAQVEIIYSAMDAIEIARNNPNKEVVFLGIGFETTTPGSAIAIEVANEEKINNFSVFSMHKLCEPILRALGEMEDFDIDGFICPGHVSIILGEKGFEFLTKEYGIPSVIAGFEGGDIVTAIYKIMSMIQDNKIEFINEYKRLVSYNGNELAWNMVLKYFEPTDDLWRGIGLVPNSGLKIRDEYSKFDAVKKFNIRLGTSENITVCKCGEIIKGKKEPKECPLFGTTCSPENPVGPCMVSSEGACAAYYKYGFYK
jgi:hydrogenase expression/formation protein HypD